MATSTQTSAMWTPGHDQFSRTCWQHKETLQLYYEPSEQFAAQPKRSFGYRPDPNVPAGPRFTPVAEPGMEAFPKRSFGYGPNPNVPAGPRFTPVAEPGMEAFPKRSFGYGPNPNVPAGPRFTPVAEPGMEAFPKRSFDYRPNPNVPAGPRFTSVAEPGMEAFPKRSFGYRPDPNVPAGPRFTPVAEPGMEAFPPRRANPHAPSGINRGGDDMAYFSPAVNVWTPGYDQFGRPCWQNRDTRKLYYDPSGQSPACPPMALGEEIYPNLPGPCIILPTRAGDEAFPAHELNERTDGRCITREMSDPSKASSTDENDAASPSASPTQKTPSPLLTGRAKEAEQWSLKHNEQGVKFYFNSTTKKSQSQTPECLKKYSTR